MTVPANADALPAITADEVAGRVADGWSLVDVRTDEEWADGRIEGSLHIPLAQLPDRMADVPEKAVLVCHSGHRSSRATAFLLGQGREAVNLLGGVQRWSEEGRDLSR